MRDEPQIGDDAGCGHRAQCRRMVQDAGDEAASCLAQTVRRVGIVHHRPPGKIDQAHVNVDAVADDVRVTAAEKLIRCPRTLAAARASSRTITARSAEVHADGGRVGHLVLTGTILR